MATLDEPPNTPTFDIANKRPELHERAKPTTSTPTTDSLAVVAQLATTVLNLAKHLTQSPQTSSTAPAMVPHTPKRQWMELRPENESPSSLPPPSPSDIPHFLKYAKDSLRIKDAANYIDGLRDKHLGPDVIDKADMQELTGFDIGMPYHCGHFVMLSHFLC